MCVQEEMKDWKWLLYLAVAKRTDGLRRKEVADR